MSNNPNAAAPERAVKSWFGLGLALTLAALSAYLWLAEEDARYMLCAIGLLFWAYPWSQRDVPAHKLLAPGSASRKPLAQTLTTMGWGLLITAAIHPLLP